MAEVTSAAELVSKQRGKSPVWLYFVICKLCLGKVSASGGNTSNLKAHLVSNHKTAAAKLCLAARRKSMPFGSHTQPPIAGSMKTKYKEDSVRWKRCTDAVSRYICKDMVSFRTVDKKAFRDMLATFDCQYQLPTRNYFSETAVPNAYQNIRSELKSVITNVDHFALTTDLWSSPKMAPYMSLTFHYMDKEWTLEAKCLQTSFLPEDHTAENLKDALVTALEEWGLNMDNLSCLTTDSGANIKAAARLLAVPWLSCFGHNLNLAVTNTINKTEKARTDHALAVCRRVNGLFSHSWRRRRDLKVAQRELGIEEHMLVTVNVLINSLYWFVDDWKAQIM